MQLARYLRHAGSDRDIATTVRFEIATTGLKQAPVQVPLHLMQKYIEVHTLATARTVSD